MVCSREVYVTFFALKLKCAASFRGGSIDIFWNCTIAPNKPYFDTETGCHIFSF